MRIDIVKQPLVVTLFLFAALAALFCMRYVSFPYPEELFTAMAPVAKLLQNFSTDFPILAHAIALIFIFSNGLTISRILSSHMVFSSRTYIPMIIYLLAGCGLWYGGADLAAASGSFLLIRASEYFITSFVRTTTFNITFRGALLIGIIPILQPTATLYLLTIPIAMGVFRRKGRETLVALIGGLIPMLTYAYVMWILDYGFVQTFVSLWEQATVSPGTGFGFGFEPDSPAGIIRLVSAGLAAAITLAGIAGFAFCQEKKRNRALTIFIYGVLLLAIGCASLFIPAAGPGDLLYLAIPVAIIMPAFFSQFPGWVSGTTYIVMLLSFAALNLYPFVYL